MSLPRIVPALLALGAALLTSHAHAQPLTLDVAEATERILAQDAQLALALAELRAAEAQLPMASATAWERPELRIGGINSADIEAGNPGLDVAIRSPIPRPGDAKRARTLAKGGIATASANAASTRWALEVEIRRAFQELALLDEEIRLLERLAKSRKGALEAWSLSLEEGATTELEVIRAELRAAEAADDLAEAQGKRRTLEGAILRWAGAEAEMVITPGAPSIPQEPTPDAWIDLALGRHPDVRAAQANVTAAKAALAQARFENLPWFDFVQGGYDWSSAANTSGLSDEGAFTLGFAFTLPRLTPGRAGIPYAQAQVARAEADVRRIENAVEEDIRGATERLQATAARGERLETGTLEAARRGIEKAEQALEEGRLSRQDVLSFQADATALSLRRLALRGDEIDAEADLLLAVGGPISQGALDAPPTSEER